MTASSSAQMDSTSSDIPPLLQLIAARLMSSDGHYIGMATLISTGRALTAAHLVENHQTYFLELIFSRSGRFTASVVARNVSSGLALLECDPEIATGLPTKILGISPIKVGAEWESIHFSPITRDVHRPYGVVDGIELVKDVPRLKLTIVVGRLPDEHRGRALLPGISGAPVIVEDQLIGLIVEDEFPTEYCYAIPASEIAKDSVFGVSQSFAVNYEGLSGSPPDEDSTSGGDTPEEDQGEVLDRLSPSARDALSHGIGILAVLRKSKLHMEHLIAGLFDKKGGPTQKEFERAGIDRAKVAELIASVVGTQLPNADAYVPQQLPIPMLSSHVRQALTEATGLADRYNSAKIRSRHLIRGALSVKECGLIEALLAAGVDPERIPMVDEPADETEQPRTRRRPTQAGIRSDDPEGEDLLDIKAEVEALCTVLASRDVKPPISLGLFGEWGSGKSFFMKKMEVRFNELKTVAQQGNSAYCSNIVQLWFNAWHYMDTNLWASLATEIFDKLAQELARQDAVAAGKDPDYERAILVAQRSEATEDVTKAAQAKRDADAKVRANEQQLTALQSGDSTVEMSPRDVLREGYRLARQQPEARETVKAAEGQLHDKVQEAAKILNMDQTPDSVKQQLLELHGLWGLVQTIVLAIRNTKNKRRLALLFGAFLIAVVAVVWLLPALMAAPWIQKKSVRFIGVVAAFLATIAPFLPMAKRALKVVRDAVKSNQEAIERARVAAESKLQQEHLRLQQSAAQAEKTLQDAVTKAQRLTNELDELRADRKMSSFIRQRQRSSDYTRYLGVIAKARNDFEQLSLLIAKEQERSALAQAAQRQRKGEASPDLEVAEPDDSQLLLPRIDRIILYIDDLDRCPEDKVVDVLQAVHLLLAFPLFVVVVGVDPRWLLHSLRLHSKAFQDKTEDNGDSTEEERTHWQSTPLNYLEKIFQIPFTLWPMGKAGFGKMVETLTEPPKSEMRHANPDVPKETSVEKPPQPVAEPTDVPPASEVNLTAEPGAASAEPTVRSAVIKKKWHQKLFENLKAIWPFGSEPIGSPAAELNPPEAPATVPVETPLVSEVTPTQTQTPPTKKRPASLAIPENIDPNPEHLQIKPWEREFMKNLHQLIPSPRATKRFVNVYRLIRAAVDLDERLALDEFAGDKEHGKYRAVLLLLAILTGYPDQATEILRDLIENEHKETWWEFIESVRKRVAKQTKSTVKPGAAANAEVVGPGAGQTANVVANKSGARIPKTNGTDRPADEGAEQFGSAEAERWEQLLGKLDRLRGVIGPTESCRDFVAWAPKVARYSFQSGRVLLAGEAQPTQNKSIPNGNTKQK